MLSTDPRKKRKKNNCSRFGKRVETYGAWPPSDQCVFVTPDDELPACFPSVIAVGVYMALHASKKETKNWWSIQSVTVVL